MIERAHAASGAVVRWIGPQPLVLWVEPDLDAEAVLGAAHAWETPVQLGALAQRGQISVRRAQPSEWTLDQSFVAHTRCTDDPNTGARSACEVRIAPWWPRDGETADLSCVMRHEWGHVMGLEHSLSKSAAMYPGGSFALPCGVHVSAAERVAAAERGDPTPNHPGLASHAYAPLVAVGLGCVLAVSVFLARKRRFAARI